MNHSRICSWLFALAVHALLAGAAVSATPDIVIHLPKGDKHVVPCERVINHLFCKAKVNGMDAGWFAVDTGASHTIIDQTIAQRMGLPAISRRALLGMQADDHPWQFQGGELVRVHSIAIGDVRFETKRFLSLNLAGLSRSFGLRIAGVIGSDLMSKVPFSIEYVKPGVTFHRPDTFAMDSPALKLAWIDSGQPAFDSPLFGEKGDKNVRLMIDTGSDSGVLLRGITPDVRRRLIKGQTTRVTLAFIGSTGFFWQVKTKMDLQVVPDQPLIKTGLEISIRPSFNRGETPSSLVGAELLRHFRTTIDYAGRRLWLEPIQLKIPLPAKEAINRPDRAGMTPLMIAIMNGDVDLAKQLIAAGADIHAKNRDGNAAIYQAVQNSFPSITHALLDAGANTSAEGENKRTLLHVAGMQSDPTVVERLLKMGVNPKAVTTEQKTTLYYAAMGGSVEIAKRLIAKGVDVNRASLKGFSPLHTAATIGHSELVNFLLANGANPNALDKERESPLVSAISRNHEKIALKLLPLTKNLDVGAYADGTAIGRAAHLGNATLVKALLEAGANPKLPVKGGRTPLMLAAMMSEPTTRMLLNAGCDPRAKDHANQTPIVYACRGGDQKIVQLLLDRGAKLNDTIETQNNVLFAAINAERYKLVPFLIEQGAAVNAKNSLGNTVLMAAIFKGETDLVTLLLQNKADPNAVNRVGTTALMTAATEGDLAMIQRLIAHKANLGAVDKNGRTAAHHAAAFGFINIVQLLLEKGVDINQADNGQQTLLHIATICGDTSMVDLLIGRDADTTIKNKEGQTAIDLAKARGHSDIVRLLGKSKNEK